ncbi:hypothetical protein [Rickettsia endosymbiont of Halotydeus destructor]|uniref:hypothetical protein n=1 Tax=Rickettsia endosymbiont of Halotydeus destructor TaxID=2996754 RepID=UPI003BB0C45D
MTQKLTTKSSLQGAELCGNLMKLDRFARNDEVIIFLQIAASMLTHLLAMTAKNRVVQQR